MRALVDMGRRDMRAATEGLKVPNARSPRDVEDFITAQYRKLRPLAVLYGGELAERLDERLPTGAASIESATRIDDIERAADALQTLAEKLDWRAPHASASLTR